MIYWDYNNHYEILIFHWVLLSAKVKEKTTIKSTLVIAHCIINRKVHF